MALSLDAQLHAQLIHCRDEFLDLCDASSDTLYPFYESWLDLCAQIEDARERDLLTAPTVRLAIAVSQTIRSITTCFQHIEAQGGQLQASMRSKAEALLDSTAADDDTNYTKPTTLPFTWVKPLLDYILENLASPYPTPDDKQTLISAAAAAGWESVSQKKLDDWMALARVRMGYTSIWKSAAVGEDYELMERYVRCVLSGDSSDCVDIPDETISDIENMHQWVVDQYDTKSAKEQTSEWAHDIAGLVSSLNTSDEDTSDDEATGDEVDASSEVAFYSDSDDETQYSDDSSCYSDTDVEPWVDEPLRGIIGTKRKYPGLQGLGFPTSSPLSRSSSSSSLSSRGHSIWSRRSSSGSTSASSVDWEEEQREENDRPTKRRRSSVELPSYDPASPAASPIEDKASQPSLVDASSSDLLLREATSPCSSSSPPSALSPEPVPFPSSALFPAESPAVMAAGSVQKRKRAASDEEDAQPVVSKRRRHSASPPSIPMQHFGALGIIGHLPWDGPSCVSSAVELELEAYALDSSPFAHGVAPEPLDDADEEVEKEDDEEENDVYNRLVDYSNERMLEEVVEDGTPGTFTWSEMQLHVLDSILSYGARPTPAATAARNTPLSSPQGFRLELPSLDDADLAYLLNIAAGPSMPPPAEMISPPLPSMGGQTSIFDLDLDVKPPLPESDVDNLWLLQGWTSASAACPIRLEEPAPFADAEVDKWAVDYLARASADLMTH